MLSDEHIIRRVRKGNTGGFRELMRLYEKQVFRLAYRILERREEAEDAAQEAFLLAYRNLDSYVEKGLFWPWLRRITVNCCLKRLPREIPSDEVCNLIDRSVLPGDPVEETVLARLALDEVRSAIAELPDSYRVAIVLRYEEGLSYKGIADTLGESVGVVQVRLHRARKMLTERLARSVQNEV